MKFERDDIVEEWEEAAGVRLFVKCSFPRVFCFMSARGKF